jgi:hypothetical protein
MTEWMIRKHLPRRGWNQSAPSPARSAVILDCCVALGRSGVFPNASGNIKEHPFAPPPAQNPSPGIAREVFHQSFAPD